jgi:hypothetical protein
MSRGSRDDTDREPSRDGEDGPSSTRHRDAIDRAVERQSSDERWSAARDVRLPKTPDRQHIQSGRERYRMRDPESALLATVGTFRVVAERDVAGPHTEYDVRSLSDQGLIESRSIMIKQRAGASAGAHTERPRCFHANARHADGRVRTRMHLRGTHTVGVERSLWTGCGVMDPRECDVAVGHNGLQSVIGGRVGRSNPYKTNGPPSLADRNFESHRSNIREQNIPVCARHARYQPSMTIEIVRDFRKMVGASGFEPPTPRSRTECSTRLSHAPTQA